MCIQRFIFIVIHWICDSDLKNSGFYFIIYFTSVGVGDVVFKILLNKPCSYGLLAVDFTYIVAARLVLMRFISRGLTS